MGLALGDNAEFVEGSSILSAAGIQNADADFSAEGQGLIVPETKLEPCFGLIAIPLGANHEDEPSRLHPKLGSAGHLLPLDRAQRARDEEDNGRV